MKEYKLEYMSNKFKGYNPIDITADCKFSAKMEVVEFDKFAYNIRGRK